MTKREKFIRFDTSDLILELQELGLIDTIETEFVVNSKETVSKTDKLFYLLGECNPCWYVNDIHDYLLNNFNIYFRLSPLSGSNECWYTDVFVRNSNTNNVWICDNNLSEKIKLSFDSNQSYLNTLERNIYKFLLYIKENGTKEFL